MAGVTRKRFVNRPGLERLAGPTTRQLVVARWLPLLVPLALKALDMAGLHQPDVFILIVAAVLLQSARVFVATGLGLGLLVFLQLLAGLAATLVLVANLLSPEDWLRFSANTALLMGYVSFIFNLIGSYLPR